MEGYETNNFFRLVLTNGDIRLWETELSFEAAKKTIGESAFIVVGEQNEELNTKVILSIKDETEAERKTLKEQKEGIAARLEIAKEIRKHKLPLLLSWDMKEEAKRIEANGANWFDKAIGMDIDPLLKYSEAHLRKVLGKCKKKQR